MELQELTPETREFDIPLDEEFPQEPQKEKPPKKRSRRRLWLLLPAALLVAAAIFVSLNFTGLTVRFFPHYALNRGLGKVMELPRPVAVGILGEVRKDGAAYNCAGLLRVQTGREGLALAAEDFTLSGGELELSFSGYLDAHTAALCAPALPAAPPVTTASAWMSLSWIRPLIPGATRTTAGTIMKSRSPRFSPPRMPSGTPLPG